MTPRLWTPDRRQIEMPPAFWGMAPADRKWLMDKGRLLPVIGGGTRQYFNDLLLDPSGTAFATITATAETVLVPTLWTPIPAFEPRAGKVYRLEVGGTVTTGTAGTMIITPRFGTAIGGVALGASPTQNYVPSITLAPFYLVYTLVFRTIGQAGANSTCVGTGYWSSNGAVATASSETACTFGSTASVSVDTSIANALWMGVTFSVAPSIIPLWHTWQSLN